MKGKMITNFKSNAQIKLSESIFNTTSNQKIDFKFKLTSCD